MPQPFTPAEKREIFKGMVVGALEAGFLRYSRRQELLRYAKRLNIGEFEAMLLIAEAQYGADDIEPIPLADVTRVGFDTGLQSLNIPIRLSFALVAAICIDLLLIYWLF